MILTDKLYRVPLAYIKKERYTGSYSGMRYMLEKKTFPAPEEGSEEAPKDPVILACTWPEPFSYEKTEEEKKDFAEFPFTEEGVTQALDWVSNMQESPKYSQNDHKIMV